MRALVQRVSQAKVVVADQVSGQIERGYLILLGVGANDTAKEAQYLVEKIVNLRIFEDSEGKMNLSLLDIKGGALVVSQFTLFADTRKGRRPSFTGAARPELAVELYQVFVDKMKQLVSPVGTGVFQAHMDVSLTNDGPVTIWLDTAELTS